MRGMIVAAGLGTRLHPLTQHRAKPAVPIRGIPMIAYSLAFLAQAGVDEVVINVMRDGVIKVAGRQVSAEALEDLLKQARARNPRQSALIRGDRGVKYEYVVRVVGICHEAAVRTSLAALEPVGPGGG